MEYNHLFSKGKIGNLELSNRIVMTAMETDMGEFSGNPSKRSINYFYQRAAGGAGLIVTGITRVNNFHGVSTPRQLSMASNSNIRGMRKLTSKIHETECKIFCQLHHPGRQNYSSLINIWPIMVLSSKVFPFFPRLFGPMVQFYNRFMDAVYTPAVRSSSDVQCGQVKQKTKPLSTRQVKRLIRQFIAAAMRAKKSGFDGVELHAAHGYLIQQFLSTRTNHRTDCYGGSFENRFRMLKEILNGIKLKCGTGFPVMVRLSVDEFYDHCEGCDKGITLDEGLKFACELEREGADAINVSSATYETMNKWLEPVTYTPGWRKYLAAEVKKRVLIPVVAANLIRSPEQAEEQIAEGTQDFCGFGRPFLCDPAWPNKAKNGRQDEIITCINCLHCFESLNKNAWSAKQLECARNPLLGQEEKFFELKKDGEGKKALVIGGGPAGLTAAAVLAKRGYQTVLAEKSAKTGGQVNLAQMPPLKLRIGVCIAEMERAAIRNGAEIKLNCEVDGAFVEKFNPELVLYTAGSVPFMPPIKGKDQPHVYSVNDILSGKAVVKGKKVVVAGSGLTGLETAEFLAEKGNAVTVIEMLDRIGPSAYHQNFEDVMEKLEKYNTQFMPGVRLDEIKEQSVLLTEVKTGNKKEVDADAVVLSIGSRSNKKLAEELALKYTRFKVAGDAQKPGKIADAVRDAFFTAREI